MTLRYRFRRLGNALLHWFPRTPRRMLLKGLSERPELAEECGFQVVPQHFYSPAVVLPEVDLARLTQPRLLPGVDLRREAALALLETLIERFREEVAAIPRDRTPESQLWLNNNCYADFDAMVLYAMMRHLRPKRYIEIGCGYSSRASTAALRRNAAEGFPCETVFVEPYPDANLLSVLLPTALECRRVQDVPLEYFSRLEAGDVLFVDTSHVIRTQNDVECELLRILPSLAPGVWVHIHDIFSPYDYPQEWLYDAPRRSFNEQYALECLLSGGDRFQVELPLYLLWLEHRQVLERLRTGTTERPAAFWLRRGPVTTPGAPARASE